MMLALDIYCTYDYDGSLNRKEANANRTRS